MRQLKFRIWDKISKIYINNIIIDPRTILIYDKTKYLDLISECDKIDKMIKRAGYDEDQFIIQQYTGLKDKGGQEIYEGDILEISDEDKPKYFSPYCHVWYSDSACYVVSFNHMHSETSCDLYMVHWTYKIVGNIFENADLIK